MIIIQESRCATVNFFYSFRQLHFICGLTIFSHEFITLFFFAAAVAVDACTKLFYGTFLFCLHCRKKEKKKNFFFLVTIDFVEWT